ncbi:hypothetical protein JB92DRAFT_3113656 [Gautieria morchelliformis]|nr:hypothetical protein JB92DRAFT_3113656 [Gautieria morchelliformis]
MGLEDDDAKYLDIRAAVHDEIAHHCLDGKSVEKQFLELKQYENPWSLAAMITSILCNRSDYHKNKEVQQPKKAARDHVCCQERWEEQVHVSIEANEEERNTNGEERNTVPLEDQAQESAVNGNDASDVEDKQGGCSH